MLQIFLLACPVNVTLDPPRSARNQEGMQPNLVAGLAVTVDVNQVITRVRQASDITC